MRRRDALDGVSVSPYVHLPLSLSLSIYVLCVSWAKKRSRLWRVWRENTPEIVRKMRDFKKKKKTKELTRRVDTL